MRRVVAYLLVAALLAMLIQLPTALAQEDTVLGDDDPYLPEPNAVVVDDAQLQQIAGQPEPPPPTGEPLPVTGGPQMGMLLLPAALLMGLGLLSYVVLRRE